MIISEPLTQIPATAAYPVAPSVAPTADFDTRWAAWLARGRAHERRARRRFAVSASVVAMGAAILYVVLGS